MYLKDLIEAAEKALEENGNIKVSVYTPNGQGIEFAHGAGVEYFDHKGKFIAPCYLSEYASDEITKVFEIEGG